MNRYGIVVTFDEAYEFIKLYDILGIPLPSSILLINLGWDFLKYQISGGTS